MSGKKCPLPSVSLSSYFITATEKETGGQPEVKIEDSAPMDGLMYMWACNQEVTAPKGDRGGGRRR